MVDEQPQQPPPIPEPYPPVPDVVKLLEDALGDALAGDLLGVAIVHLHGHYPDGVHIGSAWAGAAGEDLPRLLGAIEVLKSRILRNLET